MSGSSGFMAESEMVVRFLAHRGHDVSITTYGATDENVTLECETCAEVIFTFDLEGDLLAEVEILSQAR